MIPFVNYPTPQQFYNMVKSWKIIAEKENFQPVYCNDNEGHVCLINELKNKVAISKCNCGERNVSS